jgi:monomeric isocitrate dehydrogenase
MESKLKDMNLEIKDWPECLAVLREMQTKGYLIPHVTEPELDQLDAFLQNIHRVLYTRLAANHVLRRESDEK